MRGRPRELPEGERQLFLDLEDTTGNEHLTHTLHQPVKKGPVIEPEGRSLQIACAPAWVAEDGCYKIWLKEEGGMAYAESADGLHWVRPTLRCREHRGSLENNLVSSLCGRQVIYDPCDADPSRRYKSLKLRGSYERMVSPTAAHWRLHHNPWRLAYPQDHVLADSSQYQLSWVINIEEHPSAEPGERFSGRGRFQTSDLTVSADGIHWRQLNCPGLPCGDTGILNYDEATRTFIATLKEGEMGPHGRSIALATSSDFEHWNGPDLVFHADDEDQQLAREVIAERLANPKLQQPQHNVPADYRVDIYYMGVSRYESLYLGMAAFFYHTADVKENSDGFHHIQLLCSRDMRNWVRLGDRQPFIGPSRVDSGAYDLSQILPPARPVTVVDGELWFYYTGLKYRSPPPDADEKNSAIHLATLRRDGFMSLDADARGGMVTTDRLVPRAPLLYVNVDAGRGSLLVEAVDADGSVVARSQEVRGDQLRYPVQWKSGALPATAQWPLQLRFRLHDAALYSYWFDSVAEDPPH